MTSSSDCASGARTVGALRDAALDHRSGGDGQPFVTMMLNSAILESGSMFAVGGWIFAVSICWAAGRSTLNSRSWPLSGSSGNHICVTTRSARPVNWKWTCGGRSQPWVTVYAPGLTVLNR